jgi:hypothetical protein
MSSTFEAASTSGRPGVARTPITGPGEAARRAGWWVVGLLCTAFGLFEAVKHGAPASYLFVVGAAGPDVALLGQPFTRHERGQLNRAWVPIYNTLHFPLLPLAVVVFFSFYGSTNDQAAPGFTLGLMWLAHIAVDRALGYGLRNRDGWQRREISTKQTIGDAWSS